MDLKPLHDWAVIRPSDAQEMTAGGLYIPDSAKEKPREGVVEAIGPGAYEQEKIGKKKDENKERRFIPTTLKPGDVVLYEQYAGQSYKIGATERVLVRERDILGTLSGKTDRPAPRPLLPASSPSSASTALVKRAPERDKAAETTVKKAAPRKSSTKKGPATGVKKSAAKKTKPAPTKKAAKKKTAKKKGKKK